MTLVLQATIVAGLKGGTLTGTLVFAGIRFVYRSGTRSGRHTVTLTALVARPEIRVLSFTLCVAAAVT